MKLTSTYNVRLAKDINVCLDDTIAIYRKAVDFYIGVMLNEWDETFAYVMNGNASVKYAEALTVSTDRHPSPKYDFGKDFYKFPSYLRRSAIAEAYGSVKSHKSNLTNWLNEPVGKRGRRPSEPKAGYTYPCLYSGNCYTRTGLRSARIKVFIRNTWDWVDVSFRNTDAKYIERRCKNMAECSPTLIKKGKNWELSFPFKEDVKLVTTPLSERKIVAVDLGIRNACTISVMKSDGAVIGRRFLSLPIENDCLRQALSRIKKAQRSGAKRKPCLWAKANGINRHIAGKTAQFIIETCCLYDVDVVVMEALNLKGKKRGSKRQRLSLWKAKYVQKLVEHKAHLLGMRVGYVCPNGTSKLAFDGSGEVLRGKDSERCHNNYSLCEFSNGKLYNCDLNASYNIGSRYYIREILGEMTERSRLSVSAKVPSLIQRSTCTLSTLYDLHAAVNGVPLMRSECIMSEETKDSDAIQRQPTRTVGNRMHATSVV